MKKKGKLTLADIAHVSPGTPAGNWFRRYWLAISRVEDLKDIPLALKILGEDLVLFRDPNGQMGLLGLHCPHRGTSLEYGDIEEKGIRCPYHDHPRNHNARIAIPSVSTSVVRASAIRWTGP